MKSSMIAIVGVALAAFIGLESGAVSAQQTYQRRPNEYAGAVDARQHGYEHAYRDGADRGRQDRENRRPYSLRDNDYMIGARTYETAFGDRTAYMDGYRAGFKDGYEDGFNGKQGQYGQLYAHPGGAPAPSRDDLYAARPHSATDTAFDAGYRSGVTLGQRDQTRHSRSDFRNDPSYRSGDLGYRSSYGDRSAYQTQFRDGVERGYEDGYGGADSFNDRGNRDYGGSNRNDSNGSNRNGSNGSRNGQGQQGQGSSAGGTFTVAANRQWTPTGIRVRQGEVIRFQSSGEISFTGAGDKAGVAGSSAHKLVAGSPLPGALAGALIGRIDNGAAFGIGDQTSITAPASGLLYLGTNDDNVSDNSGQFQVVISLGGR